MLVLGEYILYKSKMKINSLRIGFFRITFFILILNFDYLRI